MSAETMTKQETTGRARTLRAHALGLLGANLALGALLLWALPAIDRLMHRSDDSSWTLQQFVQPWASDSPVAPLYGIAMSVAGVVAGLVLIVHAARLLTGTAGR
jgi:hypothetical protein